MTMPYLPVLSPLMVEEQVRAALSEDLGRAGDITSQATIQGKLVPGKLEKIRLTNQPVELAKTWFTVSSMPWAAAGPAASAARAAAVMRVLIALVPVGWPVTAR